MPEAGPSPSALRVVALGSAQTIAWASSTYLPAVISIPVARDFGISPATVFAAFSFALVVMAALGPLVGRAVDGRGGRGVLCLSNLVLAAGLGLLAAAGGPGMLFLAWGVMGAGMALGLYDAAFAALVRWRGLEARGAITGITLLGGFASTVGWPLTAWAVAAWDWRTACLLWAASHLLIALPLNWLSIPVAPAAGRPAGDGLAASGGPEAPAPRRDFLLLALFGAATAFVTSAMAAHLPAFLQAMGLAAGAAIAAAALVGPAQVAARLVEFVAGSRFRLHPLGSARLASALHPLGIALLLGTGGAPWAAAVFALLHGAGNGLITIAKGTLPLALFGSRGYGARQGILAVAQRLTQAAGPYAFALALEAWGARGAMVLTGMSAALAVLALLAVKKAKWQ